MHLPSLVGRGKDKNNPRDLFISKLGEEYTDIFTLDLSQKAENRYTQIFLKLLFSILNIFFFPSFVMEQALDNNE